VNLNSEKYRNFFVDFEGKKEISISRVDFVKGSPNNDWAGVFPDFASGIAQYIGKDKVEIIECNFSTTTGVERIASQIALMDAVRQKMNHLILTMNPPFAAEISTLVEIMIACLPTCMN
jgi:hypothetical protein